MLVVVALLVLLATLVIGVPIPLAFLTSAGSICLLGGYDPAFLMIFGFNKTNSILLLTIPLFVLAGAIMDKGGIGEKLISTVEKFVGKAKGGLGVVTVVACAVFGAVSGSSSATVSCIGSIMVPRLKENGYPDGLIGALLASSGVLGILIPPSMLMILYAWSSGESVLACFLATVVPGMTLVILFSIVNLIYAQKNPNIKVYDHAIAAAQEKEAKKALKQKGTSAIPALLMPVIILGSIYGGILTATEAAALSVIYAVPVGILYYKRINGGILKDALVSAGETAGVIMAMLFSVQILSRLYISENLPSTADSGVLDLHQRQQIHHPHHGQHLYDHPRNADGRLLRHNPSSPNPAACGHGHRNQPYPLRRNPGRQHRHGKCNAAHRASAVSGWSYLQG